MNRTMLWKAILSVLLGCVISTIVQADYFKRACKRNGRGGKPLLFRLQLSRAPTGDHDRNVVDIEPEKSNTTCVSYSWGGWRGGAKERVDRFVDVQT